MALLGIACAQVRQSDCELPDAEHPPVAEPTFCQLEGPGGWRLVPRAEYRFKGGGAAVQIGRKDEPMDALLVHDYLARNEKGTVEKGVVIGTVSIDAAQVENESSRECLAEGTYFFPSSGSVVFGEAISTDNSNEGAVLLHADPRCDQVEENCIWLVNGEGVIEGPPCDLGWEDFEYGSGSICSALREGYDEVYIVGTSMLGGVTPTVVLKAYDGTAWSLTELMKLNPGDRLIHSDLRCIGSSDGPTTIIGTITTKRVDTGGVFRLEKGELVWLKDAIECSPFLNRQVFLAPDGGGHFLAHYPGRSSQASFSNSVRHQMSWKRTDGARWLGELRIVFDECLSSGGGSFPICEINEHGVQELESLATPDDMQWGAFKPLGVVPLSRPMIGEDGKYLVALNFWGMTGGYSYFCSGSRRGDEIVLNRCWVAPGEFKLDYLEAAILWDTDGGIIVSPAQSPTCEIEGDGNTLGSFLFTEFSTESGDLQMKLIGSPKIFGTRAKVMPPQRSSDTDTASEAASHPQPPSTD